MSVTSIHFPSSANADQNQSLFLYVLADHRIDKQNNFGSSRVAYADWVEPSSLASGFPTRRFSAIDRLNSNPS